MGGFATFVYWVPLNILLVKHADKKNMGSNLAWFFAMPKIFSIVAPLLSAVFIYLFDFWVIFLIAIFGMFLSFLPLTNIYEEKVKINIKPKNIFQKIKKRKSLLFFGNV